MAAIANPVLRRRRNGSRVPLVTTTKKRASARTRVIETDEAIVIGARRVPLLRDLYHLFLRAQWWQAIAGIVVTFLSINLVFGSLYFLVGGIANARSANFFDMFVFSVQTIATIGYGGMEPTTVASNALMIGEAVVGLLLTAITTGL